MTRALPVLSRSAVYADLPPAPPDFDGFGARGLTDARGRRYTYLRFSVTDRCDLACVYCMPPGGEIEHALRPELLGFEEVARVVSVFASGGVRRVRFTGGEPLVRKDVVRLVELVHERCDDLELVLTTNATRLSELAAPLSRAGLRGVNISLDTLDPERFRRLTRGGDLGRVLAGVHAALDVGLEVKINAVALRDTHFEDEARRLVDWAWDLGITPRFIELMPIGEAAKLPAETFLGVDAVVSLLGARLDASDAASSVATGGPARYLRAADGSERRVGFITAMSETFCDDCNRVRVSARGDIRACLASRNAVSLRDLLRAGASDRELAWAISWSLGDKDVGHHFLDDHVEEHRCVGMSLIGG